MLISSKKTAVNQVYTGTVDVEVDSLESAYFKAYGEPKIELNGTIPFSPSSPQQAPGQIDIDQTADLGSPPIAGSAVDNDGLGNRGIEVTGSGIFPTALDDTIGFYNYALEVVSDFEMSTRLLAVQGGLATNGTDPATVDGFRVGLALFFGGGSSDPSVILGWGSHNSAFDLALYHRTAAGGAYTVVNSVPMASPNGLMLRLTRTSTSLKAEYSTDSGETWVTLGTTTLTNQTYRAGLFVNSGDGSEATTALMDEVSLTQTPVEDVNVFTIDGSKTAFMHGQAPHIFSLDGKVEPEAEAKVQGWMDEINLRLTQAKTDLFLNNDTPSADVIQV